MRAAPRAARPTLARPAMAKPFGFVRNMGLHRVFSTAQKSDMSLNAAWMTMAKKELRGKDVHETLVRETNEQMLVKPLYTAEDLPEQVT